MQARSLLSTGSAITAGAFGLMPEIAHLMELLTAT
jgi:hypothetical protein